MPRFTITVKKSEPDANGKYGYGEDIYEQVLDTLDVSELAIFLNNKNS